LQSVFDAGTTLRFWWSLLATHLVAWTFLCLTCLTLPSAWQDKPIGLTGVPWRDRLGRWMLGSPATRRGLRRALLGRNPFYWLASRERLRPVSTWMFIAGVPAIIALDVAMIALVWAADPNVLEQRIDDTFILLGYVLVVFAGMNVMLFVDLAALGTMGMWGGLKARLPSHAASPAVLAILVLPWVVLLSTFTAMAILRPAWLNEMKFAYFIWAWIALGIVTDVLAIIRSHRKLRQEFRIVATQRFQPPRTRRHWLSALFEEVRAPFSSEALSCGTAPR
jgi:hypothetical protein